jgi:hypothetical protein
VLLCGARGGDESTMIFEELLGPGVVVAFILLCVGYVVLADRMVSGR